MTVAVMRTLIDLQTYRLGWRSHILRATHNPFYFLEFGLGCDLGLSDLPFHIQIEISYQSNRRCIILLTEEHILDDEQSITARSF